MSFGLGSGGAGSGAVAKADLLQLLTLMVLLHVSNIHLPFITCVEMRSCDTAFDRFGRIIHSRDHS